MRVVEQRGWPMKGVEVVVEMVEMVVMECHKCEEYERELFEIGDVGVVLVGRGDGEDDIENLRRGEKFRSEDVIGMKKNDDLI
ncbi:hypothetical protein Tco_0567547 [Tanacetum coccineum]